MQYYPLQQKRSEVDFWKEVLQTILLLTFQWIKNELWVNPLQYFMDSELDVTENGLSSDDDYVHQITDDSVVIVGDDTDDDGNCLRLFSTFH